MAATLPTSKEMLASELEAANQRIAALEAQLARQAIASAQPAAELLETAVAHSPIVLWSTDREGRFTLSEGRGLEPLGLQPGQVVGLSAFELYAENPDVIASLQRALNGEEVVTHTVVTGRVFESWTAPLRDLAGSIIGLIGVATDVTARANAEAAERQFRVRFQRVFERSSAGIMLTDFETGRLIDVNPAFCQLLEQNRDELLGKTTIEIGFWANLEERQAVLSTVTKVRNGSPIRHRLRTKNGRTRFVECRGDTLEIDGRQCMLTVVHDATATHRYSQMLHRSQRRLRALTRYAPVGIFRCTILGWIVDTNRQLLRLWNVERPVLIAEEWWHFIKTEDQTRVAEQWQFAMSNRTAFATEFRIETVTGDERWFFAQADPPQKSGGVVVTATDISAQKRSEKALHQLNEELEVRVAQRTAVLVNFNQMLEEQIYERRRAADQLAVSNEKWRSLVENAPDLILLVDREYKITFINHTSIRPELKVSDVVGASVFEFLFPEYRDKVRADLDRVFNNGESVSHEVAGPNHAGERLWFQSHIAPVWHNGKVVSTTIVCRDVTQQRQAADELKQKQDLLTHVGRVSMVGEMTAAIAHELFQPLSAIANYVRGCMIRLQRNEPATEDVLSSLQEAVDEAHRASEIVRRMRQFLQRNELKQEVVSVHELFHDVQRLSEPAVRRGEALCQVEFPEPAVSVSVDRIQIVQVLLNLVLNAVESLQGTTGQTREIRVSSACPTPGVLEMMVADNGPGIPSHLHDQIFEAFVTTKTEGLGLGLSISRSIVEGHGGKMSVAPASERGAVFVVRLPACIVP